MLGLLLVDEFGHRKGHCSTPPKVLPNLLIVITFAFLGNVVNRQTDVRSWVNTGLPSFGGGRGPNNLQIDLPTVLNSEQCRNAQHCHKLQ